MKKKTSFLDQPSLGFAHTEFFSWLLPWADRQQRDNDAALHTCAVALVRILLNKTEDFQIHSVRLASNSHAHDCCVWINDKYELLLVDERGMLEDPPRIEMLRIKAWKPFEEDPAFVLVHCLMGAPKEESFLPEFRVLRRPQLLELLKTAYRRKERTCHLPEFLEYLDLLTHIDVKVNHFRYLPLDFWEHHCWQGFFAELQAEVKGTWRYNYNKRNLTQVCIREHLILDFGEESPLRVRLELWEEELLFVLYDSEKKDVARVRDLFLWEFRSTAKSLEIPLDFPQEPQQERPYAVLKGDYRILNQNGLLDWDATVKNLFTFSFLLEETERRLKAAM